MQTLAAMGEAEYQTALKLERGEQYNKALMQFESASYYGHLLATLRLAQIYDQRMLCRNIDRELAALYYKTAARLSGAEDVLAALFKEHPNDAIVFIALMCKALVIASESGRYTAHAISALAWYLVLKQIGKLDLIEDPDVFERLERQLSETQIIDASDRAAAWMARFSNLNNEER